MEIINSKEDCLSRISALGNKNDWEYPERVKELVLEKGFSQKEVDVYNEILADQLLEYETRFHAIYIILVYYRTNRFFSKILSLCEKYRIEFRKEPLFLAAKSIALSFSGRDKDLQNAINCAYQAVKTNSSNDVSPALLINYASVVARKFENEIKEIDNKKDMEIIKYALKCTNQAMQIKPKNGKYYSVRGRLLSLQDKFREAKEDISKAIDLLDSQLTNYRFILSEYYDILTKIRIRENYKRIKDQEKKLQALLDENTRSINNSQIKLIEILSLFIAIITVIFGGTNLAARVYQPWEFLVCIAFLFGCVIAVYSSVRLINKSKNIMQIILTLLFTVITLFVICGIAIEELSWLMRNL